MKEDLDIKEVVKIRVMNVRPVAWSLNGAQCITFE